MTAQENRSNNKIFLGQIVLILYLTVLVNFIYINLVFYSNDKPYFGKGKSLLSDTIF